MVRKNSQMATSGRKRLEDYTHAIEYILQAHDSVEVVHADGTIVKLK